MRPRNLLSSLFCALCAFCGSTLLAVDARMLRRPDVSATDICFVYAGDVWIVPKTGGTARRLSSPQGEESFPRFSPDGSEIAFTGNYDGNADVYVVPAQGGPVRRLTYHPAPDRVIDWDPTDGSILIASPRDSETIRYSKFFRVPAHGGPARRLPVPYGEFAAFSDDAEWLAYTPRTVITGTWKRYRGGTTADIWLFNLRTCESRNLTADAAGDEMPMWRGRTVYFLSDRGATQRYSLWAADLDSGTFRQLTDLREFDISSAAIGPHDIVFEAGGRLHLFNLETERHQPVDIDLVTDLSTLRPQLVQVSDLIRSATVSPSGKRIIVEARGELFSIPAQHGPIYNLTQSSGAAEVFPAWSPDGKTVAYVTDCSGEYQLATRPADGSGTETVLTSFPDGYRYQPWWSPDSRKLAFVDHAQQLNIHDIDRGRTTVIDQLPWLYHGDLRNVRMAWSPDSRWIAYDKSLDHRNAAVFVADAANGQRHQITSGGYHDFSPVFDPDGKYLYFLTSRHLRPIYDDLQNTWIYANTVQIAALPLRRDVASPLKPRNDDEPGEDSKGKRADKASEGKDRDSGDKDQSDRNAEEGSEATASDNDGKDAGDAPEASAKKDKPDSRDSEVSPVEIDFTEIERRAVILPPKPGQFADLAAVKGRIFYRRIPNKGADGEDSPLLYYDLEEREEKTVLPDADGFQITSDGKKALVRRNREFVIIELKPGQKFEKPLPTANLEMTVHPAEEWRQIFEDAWRFNRDYFYDPSHHGLDWARIREHYSALLEDAVTRWDVNFVIGEMIGELNASHTYRGGGAVENAPQRPVGLLGADLVLDQGTYRIARILRGAPWDSEVRSSLDEPGVEIREGDFLLAVNGVRLTPDRCPWQAFQGLAGKVVRLTLNDRPEIEGGRHVLVTTLTFSQEQRLRHLAWIEANRQTVEKATDGRVGYVYVPDTGVHGQTELMRQFRAQLDREALIIDERFNSGGQLGDRFLELLARRPYTFLAYRYGPDMPWPPVGHFGPQVMLINGWSGSGGDAFPWFFRTAQRGSIIGERTWGGLIGPAVGHQLIDGGVVVVPPGRLFGPDGEWFAEGHGVDPDIEVIDDPTALARGTDPQLERGIAEVQRLLSESAFKAPARPAYQYRGWPR